MLRHVAAEDKRDWDLMLPYVLFGILEVPQSSTGFTPFKLLFGWQLRGLGPYMVLEKTGPVRYRVRQPGRRRLDLLYHVNLLKKWIGTRDQLPVLANTEPLRPPTCRPPRKLSCSIWSVSSPMCSPQFRGRPKCSIMTFEHHQGSSLGNGPIKSRRLVCRLLRRKSSRC